MRGSLATRGVVLSAAVTLSACADEAWSGGQTEEAAGALIAAGLIVDDDRAQCPQATFTTIQAAVDAAAPGGVITVCAGVYAGRVVIDEPLTLLGAQAGRDARSRPLVLSAESVVTSDAPFRILAGDVTLDGFYIRDLATGGDEEDPGVTTTGTGSGYRFLNNVFESTSVGLFPRSSGATETIIRRNLFLGAIGIATGEIDGFGATNNTTIIENRFVRALMFFSGGGDVGLRIVANTLIESGIILSSVEDVLVERNKIFFPPQTALSLSLAENVLVRDNILRNGELFGIAVLHETSDVEVVNNRIAGFQEAGILLSGSPVAFSSGTVVMNNEVEDGSVGIALFRATNNLIAFNNVEDNTGVAEDDTGIGIQVGTESFDNTFVGNEARGNTVLDCRDQSSGNGTLGTANTWEDNEGSRSSPDGICPDR